MAGDIEAGRAFVRLLADDQQLRDKFAQIEKDLQTKALQVAKIGAVIGAVGLAITGPLTLAARHFVDVGSHLQKVSERTGATVERLSELKYAAEQSGAGIDVVENSMRRMQITIADASRGVDSAVGALSRLGIKLEEIAGLPPDEQFRLVAARLREIPDPAERAAAAVSLLGKSGAALIPMTNELESLIAEAREAGMVMSSEAAEGATRLGDALDRARAITSSMSGTLGAALAPALERVVNRYAQGATQINKWLEGHEGLVITAGALGYALSALSPVVVLAAGAIRTYAAAQAIATGTGIALNVVLLTTLLYAAAFLAGFLLMAGVLYLFTDRLDFLKKELGDAGDSLKKMTRESQQQSAAQQNIQRRHNEEMARLEREATEKRIAASRERDRKLQEQIATENRTTLELQRQFNAARGRQNREGLDNFLDVNARKLKEAEELQRQLFAVVFPERAAADDKRQKAAEERAELERQFKLLQDIGQLRQNAKLATVRDLADRGERKLERGVAPNRDEISAITRLSGDGGIAIRQQLIELKKHTTSLSEIAVLLRDTGTIGGDE